MPEAPSPVVDDPDTGGFWQAAQRGALAVQWCDRCDRPIHLPRPQCPRCGSAEPSWRDVDGDATVHSWTVVRHPVHPAFPVPYTVALVELTAVPEVHLLTYLDGAPALRPGQRMRRRPDRDAAGVVIPQWEPVPDDTEGV